MVTTRSRPKWAIFALLVLSWTYRIFALVGGHFGHLEGISRAVCIQKRHAVWRGIRKRICKALGFRYIATMSLAPPVVLTIAGFDPCSGAGVTADIKSMAAHGCYGVACITALTVQSTAAVRRVEVVDAKLVDETLSELASDLAIAAVHIGMLGSGKIVQTVARFLGTHKLSNVVLDPILKSSSGTDLLDAAGVRLLIDELLPLAAVITPSLFCNLQISCCSEKITSS